MGKEEAKVQTDIINWLVFQGAWVVKTIATTKNGTPDVLAALPITREQALKWFETHETLAMFAAVEVKKPGGSPSPLQRVQLRKIKEAGGLGCVADNTQTVKDYVEFLKES